MKTHILPNGTTINYEGGLDELKQRLAMAGVDFVPTPEETKKDNDFKDGKVQIITEYRSAIQTLSTIENKANPTNTEIVTAVRFLAKTLKLALKILIRLVQ